MKRLLPLLLAVLLCAACLACRSESTGIQPETPVGLPNPVKEVADASAFDCLALHIDAPTEAENVRYSIISDEIAQVHFDLDGRAYIYRAANAAEDISGIYETFDAEEQGVEADGESWYASIRIRTIRGGKGGALATWNYAEAQYSLYTGDAVNATEIGDLAVRLAQKVCPAPESAAASDETPDAVLELRAPVDESVQTALYGYFRGVCYDADWFDAHAEKGIRICVYAAREYGAGILAVADFYIGGELAPDLFYIEDGAVQSATTGSDCWAINYTRINGNTIVYGKSFAWDGKPMATTHAVAAFSDGSEETVELIGEAEDAAQPGFLFVCEQEAWLDTLTLYNGDTAVADQDCGEFTMSEVKDRFAAGAPLCQWTRFNPVLDAAARERRFMDAASSTIQVALVKDQAAGLRRWYKDSGAVFPDLWRTLHNGKPVHVKSNQPVLLDGLNREDVHALYWVELKLDDGTEAGITAAVQQSGAGMEDSRASDSEQAGLFWSTPGAPNHYGLYMLVLDNGDCWYTALFDVEREDG